MNHLEFTSQQQDALMANASQAAALLKAMANPNRLMILCTLLDQELTVGELNAVVPLSQSALSQHLAALRNARLVDTRRESQTIYYRLAGSAASKVIAMLKDLYCNPPGPEPEQE